MKYKSIDTIPIYNYFKCAYGDLRYLQKLDSYDFEYVFKDEDIEIFNKIEEEFEQRMGTSTAEDMRFKHIKIIKLKKKYLDLKNMLILLAIKHDVDVENAINKLGYKYKESTREIDLKRIKGELYNLDVKIKENTPELAQKVDFNIFELVGQIENNMKININPYTATISQFMAYTKILKVEAN